MIEHLKENLRNCDVLIYNDGQISITNNTIQQYVGFPTQSRCRNIRNRIEIDFGIFLPHKKI